MKERRILLKYKGQNREPTLKVCNWWLMFRGLMFRRREKAEALLLFDLKKPRRWKIHSMFVFFPFVAIWLDEKGKIVGKEIVKPWTFSIRPSGEFTKLIEIPYNQKYSGIVEFLVGKSS